MDTFIIVMFFLSLTLPLLHLLHCLPFFRDKTEKVKRNPILKEWMIDRGYEKEKGISILVPCFNEQGIIETSIQSMESLTYSQFEVIYINDGSTDDTMEILNKNLQLRPCSKVLPHHLSHKMVKGFYQSELYSNIYVIDKLNGGKADGLNAGIEYSSEDVVITLDADTILTNPALSVINDTFEDEDVVAAGGMVHVLQTKTAEPLKYLSLLRLNMLLRVQTLDFLKAFYITKMSLSRFQALAIISGAFGIFKKQVLFDVGGYRSTIGEDIDMTLRIHKYVTKLKNKKIIFLPEAVCYTELPETWKDLFKQRLRWQKAFIDCVIHFRSFFLKTLFTKSVTFFYIIESFFIGTIASYVITGIVVVNTFLNFSTLNFYYISFYMLYILIIGIAYDLMAVGMNRYHGFSFQKRNTYHILSAILFDVFVYRFISMYFVMYGSISYFFNKSWNKVERTGRNYQTDSKRAA